MRLNFTSKKKYIYMLHKKTVLVKKRHFCLKKLLFHKLTGYKNTAFLQQYIFVKKLLFYVKICFFTKDIFVRKLPFYVKILLFTHINFREKRASCSSFRPFNKPIYRRQAIFYSMVRTVVELY